MHTRVLTFTGAKNIDGGVDYLRQKALLCGACQETRSGKLMIALHEAISPNAPHPAFNSFGSIRLTRSRSVSA